MKKDITFKGDALDKLKEGVDKLANAVRVTLGPKGENVLIEEPYGPPKVTKDGISVANSIDLVDPVENAGAEMIKAIAAKTAEVAGDGTSTATILGQAIFTYGLKYVSAGANVMEIKRGIEKGVKYVVEELKKMSIEVGSNSKMIEHVGAISANNDMHTGKLIAKCMKKVGISGIITVEKGEGLETTIEQVEGMKVHQGWLSPFFMTEDGVGKMQAILKNPYVLIFDQEISDVKQIMPVLELTAGSGRPLLIIAEDITSNALNTLVLNRAQGGLSVCGMKSPGYGPTKRDQLEDLAIVLGGKVISDVTGGDLDNLDLEEMGTCEKAIIGQNSSLFVGGAGTSKAIKNRVSQLNIQADEADLAEASVLQLKGRIAGMKGGVAIIRIGAATEIEMNEKRDLVDDALASTKAATEEGIIPGGGVAYIRIAETLKYIKGDTEDESSGIQIVAKAIEEPLRQIILNCGLEPGVIIDKIKKGKKNFGYNARTDKFGDLVKQGVIDPTKVARCAIENAASAGSLLLTTGCVITNNQDFRDKVIASGGKM